MRRLHKSDEENLKETNQVDALLKQIGISRASKVVASAEYQVLHCTVEKVQSTCRLRSMRRCSLFVT